MNSRTARELLKFIEAVEGLALAVSAVAGTDATQVVFEQGGELRLAIKSDETILEVR
jgi:hypothetical protein